MKKTFEENRKTLLDNIGEREICLMGKQSKASLFSIIFEGVWAVLGLGRTVRRKKNGLL